MASCVALIFGWAAFRIFTGQCGRVLIYSLVSVHLAGMLIVGATPISLALFWAVPSGVMVASLKANAPPV